MQCEVCGKRTNNKIMCNDCADAISAVKGDDKYWWLNIDQKMYKPDYKCGRVREV
ncbi:MAG: hypothetical protein K9K32_04580 [Halanaerobiales bacterium]|nr:hypothetical protein [Halanaerobiales bacterium]